MAKLSDSTLINTLNNYGFTRQGEDSGREVDPDNWDSYPAEISDLPNFGDREGDVAAPNISRSWARAGEVINKSATSPEPLPPPGDVDALAWYLPFHYYGWSWGIYVKESEVLMIAGKIKKFLGGPPSDEYEFAQLTRMALSVLYLHEAFHHKVESFATRLEIARLLPVYLPYNESVYKPLRGTDLQLEESMACAEMLNRLKEKSFHGLVRQDIREATDTFLRQWIPTLPPSYRRGIEFSERPDTGTLLSQIASSQLKPKQPKTDWDIATQMIRGLFNRNSVVHILVPVGTTPMIPWFDVDRFLAVSTRDVEKLLRIRGYVEVHGGKGSHRKFKCADKPTVTLPANREALSPGVQRQIAGSLGLRDIRQLAAAV